MSQLHAAGFAVTAVTRSKASSSLPSFPPDVAVKEVDFSSPASLAAVLDGQDAVVSTLGLGAILGGQQAALAEAAAAPGSSVRRFVPSEFGVDTRNVPIPNMRALLTAKVKAREDLEEKARLNPEFSWTALSVGYFFDWVRRLAVPS